MHALKKQFKENTFNIQKTFSSKKNNVFLSYVPDSYKPLVIKQYATSIHTLAYEHTLLTFLYEKGVRVPQIYYKGDDFIAMSYVSGLSLVEIIEELEKTFIATTLSYHAKKIVVPLVTWLTHYYASIKTFDPSPVILNDVNLRNFILTPAGITGVDFEDCTAGDIETDIGKICAFILTYTPMFTSLKIALVQCFLKYTLTALPLCKQKTNHAYLQEIQAIIQRRGYTLNRLPSYFNSMLEMI